jgi:hypothetical protein
MEKRCINVALRWSAEGKTLSILRPAGSGKKTKIGTLLIE